MTLHAVKARDAGEPGGERDVTVQATYGPVTFKITEDAGHLRVFWSQLGRLINEVEGKSAGQRAYERYREHAGGVALTNGDPLPAWEENDQKYRDAWDHAAG